MRAIISLYVSRKGWKRIKPITRIHDARGALKAYQVAVGKAKTEPAAPKNRLFRYCIQTDGVSHQPDCLCPEPAV